MQNTTIKVTEFTFLSGLRRSGGEDFKFGGVLLINDLEKDGINGDVAVDVDLEVVVPPQDSGGASDVDGGVEDHLAASDVLDEARGMVR